jgi:PTS system galactitol-specific IIA component
MNIEKLSFTDLVKPEFVICDLVADDREDALRKMSRILVDKGYCLPSFVEGILTRERHHPSALPMAGHKIAIPHTDAEHVRTSVILFARLAHPVEFLSMGDVDEKLQVQMISMFALKEKRLIGDLLETLITVYQHDEILAALLRSVDSGEMYAILRAGVEKYGK